MAHIHFSIVAALTMASLAACSSKSAAPDVSTTPSVEDAGPSGPGPDATSSIGEDAAEADDVVDERAARLEALTRLEVPTMTRSRGALQRDLVTLAFDTAPNARGQSAAVELTVAACDPCATPTVGELEVRKDTLLQQPGELHAKNPELVFVIEPLELAPQRSGSLTYARSWVDDGTTRAVVHTLEVQFADNGFAFRFQAYPRGGFPASGEELATALTRAELETAVRQIFVAASDVLWPPARPE